MVKKGVSEEFCVRYSAGQEGSVCKILRQVFSWPRNSPHFMEPEGLSHSMKDPTIYLYSKPDQSTPSHPKSNSTSIPLEA